MRKLGAIAFAATASAVTASALQQGKLTVLLKAMIPKGGFYVPGI
jgi:hypothetical protein